MTPRNNGFARRLFEWPRTRGRHRIREKEAAILPGIGFDIDLLLNEAALIALAFALAFPIGWECGHGRRSTGFRSLPVVAMAACGFALILGPGDPANSEQHARVIQGVITGIGFIGGGAIVKHVGNVQGLVTAASIWNAGAIGLAIGFGRTNIAVVLSVFNLLSLWVLGLMEGKDTEDVE
jgi:putative Mg2+ transporter-C (MgtC) family protein